MSHAFADIAFTSAVKAAQVADGSRASYARAFEQAGAELHHRELGVDEIEFLAARRSFVMASVSETGWPYVQHRGGPAGFVKAVADNRIAWADYAGNRQMITVGNVAGNDRVALLFIDHASRSRLKLLGRLSVEPLSAGSPLHEALATPGYPARAQRAFVVTVQAYDWNCPQHIPVMIEAERVQQALDQRDARIAELQARLEQLEELHP
jgi:uncharacterized protein